MTENEWLKTFSENLESLIKDGNTSQNELAKSIGVTPASINNYLKQRRMPSIKALINMSTFFGVTLDDLMYFGEDIE